MKASILVLPMLLALGACDSGTPDASTTDQATPAEEPAVAPGAPAPEDTPEPAQAAPVTQIPASIQGRWGLVSADCEPGRDDAKGLLVISGRKLEFYESVGTLASIEEAEGDRIRGAFDFSGEGMNWKLDVVLDVQDGGATLIRREYGDDAAPGPLRYARCTQGN